MVETIQWTDDGVVMIDQTRLPRRAGIRHLPRLPRGGDGNQGHDHPRRSGDRCGCGDGGRARSAEIGGPATPISTPICDTLAGTRPTAVNLFWAIDRMRMLYAQRERASPSRRHPSPALIRGSASRSVSRTSRSAGRSARMALSWCRTAKTVLTHCNAGRAGDRGLRNGAGRDSRGRGGREEDRRLRR